MADKGEKKIVSPDIEVIVRGGGRELVVIAYFADAYGGFDVLVGVADFDLRDGYASTLRSAASAVLEAVPYKMGTDEDGSVR